MMASCKRFNRETNSYESRALLRHPHRPGKVVKVHAAIPP